MAFKGLNETEEQELYRLLRFYRREATRSAEAKAYLAGCCMLGSALETALMLMVSICDDEAEATGKVPLRKGLPKPLLKWDLAELLRVAKAAGWLPSGLDLDEEWSGRRAKVGDYAEAARQIRNLTHPARYLQDHFAKRVTARYFKRQLEIVDASCDWLMAHNNRALQAAMKQEERERATASAAA